MNLSTKQLNKEQHISPEADASGDHGTADRICFEMLP
jgi:hypothetical protein